MNIQQLNDEIFQADVNTFESLALRVFAYQYTYNSFYRQYADLLNKKPQHVQRLEDIPFLPVSFFKSHTISCSPLEEDTLYFESSTTTGQIPSTHYILHPKRYEQSFLKAFERFIGKPEEFCILGLLPSYLERKHSSLVYMVDHLIKQSKHSLSGFYLHDYQALAEVVQTLEHQKQQTILFGVTYALLDFAEQFPQPLHWVKLMETGGMKGRREELTRTAVHERLKQAFAVKQVYSEYGMTELLSQAYCVQNERFVCPPWMKVMVRELHDPLSVQGIGKGAINIIDLANLDSCAFLATDDFGHIHSDQSFEVMGRIDHSEIRGCALLTVND